MRTGEPSTAGELRVHRGETQPPKRHTEATLLEAVPVEALKSPALTGAWESRRG